MQAYCVSCKKNTELQMKSICSVFGNKKSRFVSNDQKGHGLCIYVYV